MLRHPRLCLARSQDALSACDPLYIYYSPPRRTQVGADVAAAGVLRNGSAWAADLYMDAYASCSPRNDTNAARGVCPDREFEPPGAPSDNVVLRGATFTSGVTTVELQRPLLASPAAGASDLTISALADESQDWVWAHGALRPGEIHPAYRLRRHSLDKGASAFGSLLGVSLTQCAPPCAPLAGTAAAPAPAAARPPAAPAPRATSSSTPMSAPAPVLAATRIITASAPAPSGQAQVSGGVVGAAPAGETLVGGGLSVRWELKSEGSVPGVVFEFESLRVRPQGAALLLLPAALRFAQLRQRRAVVVRRPVMSFAARAEANSSFARLSAGALLPFWVRCATALRLRLASLGQSDGGRSRVRRLARRSLRPVAPRGVRDAIEGCVRLCPYDARRRSRRNSSSISSRSLSKRDREESTPLLFFLFVLCRGRARVGHWAKQRNRWRRGRRLGFLLAAAALHRRRACNRSVRTPVHRLGARRLLD